MDLQACYAQSIPAPERLDKVIQQAFDRLRLAPVSWKARLYVGNSPDWGSHEACVFHSWGHNPIFFFQAKAGEHFTDRIGEYQLGIVLHEIMHLTFAPLEAALASNEGYAALEAVEHGVLETVAQTMVPLVYPNISPAERIWGEVETLS